MPLRSVEGSGVDLSRGLKQNASGTFQSTAAYQLIGSERIERAFHLRGWRDGRNASRPLNSGVRRLI